MSLPNAPKLLPAKIIDRGRFGISYVDIGDRSNPAIVLCHGLASSGRQFNDDAEFFVQHGFRVILPDLRGHGRSTLPAHFTQDDFSIANMASDLIAILDDAGIKSAHYVGNSLGGILALHLLPVFADRFKSFTTFGTSYALNTPKIPAQALPTLYQFVGAEWVDNILAQSTSADPQAQATVKLLLSDYNIEVVSHIARNVGRYDFIDHARQFPKPIMMLRGGQDKLVNAALMKTVSVMKQLNNFILFDIEKAGHCANLDATLAVRVALLGFFKLYN